METLLKARARRKRRKQMMRMLELKEAKAEKDQTKTELPPKQHLVQQKKNSLLTCDHSAPPAAVDDVVETVCP